MACHGQAEPPVQSLVLVSPHSAVCRETLLGKSALDWNPPSCTRYFTCLVNLPLLSSSCQAGATPMSSAPPARMNVQSKTFLPMSGASNTWPSVMPDGSTSQSRTSSVPVRHSAAASASSRSARSSPTRYPPD